MDELKIKELLVLINSRIENSGVTLNTFRYSINEEDLSVLKTISDIDELKLVVNACKSRGYLAFGELGSSKNYVLTSEGQRFALSNNGIQGSNTIFNINNLSTNGATQFGNNNAMNVTQLFYSMIDCVDRVDGLSEEKESIKKKIKEFMAHPLFVNVAAAAVAGLCNKL